MSVRIRMLALGLAVVAASAVRAGEYNAKHDTVELFAAMDAGQLEVKFVGIDDAEGRVIIRNKADRPLNVKLPEAFAGVPVLAQLGGGGLGGGGGAGGGGSSQGVGGGMGGGGGGLGGAGGGAGGGGGFFNIAPEKAAHLKVATLCLDHGKPEPRPAIEYKLVPLASYCPKAETQEMIKMFATGRLNREAAQAAIWHLQNDMSWEALAGKTVRRINQGRVPYFSQQQLYLAVNYTRIAAQRAEEARNQQPTPPSPGETAQAKPAAE